MPQTLASYGDNTLARQSIPVHSGTVRVQGGGLPPNHSVWLAGAPVPVDPQGNFVSEAILPEVMHTVEVAVLDTDGSGELYLRDLKLKENARIRRNSPRNKEKQARKIKRSFLMRQLTRPMKKLRRFRAPNTSSRELRIIDRQHWAF